MSAHNPFSAYLLDCWRMRLFSNKIFPGFPFRPAEWLALAFSRDNHGNIRIPKPIWRILIAELELKTREQTGFIVSPEALIAGSVMVREQPFVVALNELSVLAYFNDASRYLPDFFMAGASEKWAIWGDSDFTVLGGELELMSGIINAIGGRSVAFNMMVNDFNLTESSNDEEMRLYLGRLAPA